MTHITCRLTDKNRYRYDIIRYNMIRDAVIACAQKLTTVENRRTKK